MCLASLSVAWKTPGTDHNDDPQQHPHQVIASLCSCLQLALQIPRIQVCNACICTVMIILPPNTDAAILADCRNQMLLHMSRLWPEAGIARVTTLIKAWETYS